MCQEVLGIDTEKKGDLPCKEQKLEYNRFFRDLYDTPKEMKPVLSLLLAFECSPMRSLCDHLHHRNPEKDGIGVICCSNS